MADDLTVIVLAAGGGTRMKSKVPKVLHEVGGRSMIGHVLVAVQSMRPRRVVAVVGHQREQVGPHVQGLMPECVLAVQEVQHGTGHAVRLYVDTQSNGRMTFNPDGTGESNGTILYAIIRNGTLYTMIAGLLNILAIWDAYAGPVISEPPKKERGPPKKENDE